MRLQKKIQNPDNWIKNMIDSFINESPENTLKNQKNEKAWAEPLTGFSSGADPIYQFYQRDIGSFYLLPFEIFTYAFPKITVTPDQLAIISWILPQTETTKSEHRKQSRFPTERWARARIYGEEVNNKLRKYVVSKLLEAGYEAVAPILSPLWKRRRSKKYLFASTWSERHAAYAAGLGTFGLCDGLITPKGKAMRCGSIIAKINIKPTPRPYNDHHAYCLFYSKGTCAECVNRCPADALSKTGHNKRKCSKYLNMTKKFVETNYGFKGYGCGLCQTDVPCESKIPPEIFI